MRKSSVVTAMGMGLIGALCFVFACSGTNREPTSPSGDLPGTGSSAQSETTGTGGGSSGTSGNSGSSGGDNAVPGGKGGPNEGTQVNSLGPFTDGLNFGITDADVSKHHTKTGGVFDQEYNPVLKKLQPGVHMQAVEAERDQKKASFQNNLFEFKDTPFGYDTTGLRQEYAYKNNERVQVLEREWGKRLFFYMNRPPNDKFYKRYDEVKLGEGGIHGKTYQEVVTKFSNQIGSPGKFHPADPAKKIPLAYTDWQDARMHLRIVDRTSENLAGVVLEDLATYRSLAQLRPNGLGDNDPMAMDPSIALVTKGGISDPNAAVEQKDAGPGKKPGKKDPKKK